jgi:hypothetical protein
MVSGMECAPRPHPLIVRLTKIAKVNFSQTPQRAGAAPRCLVPRRRTPAWRPAGRPAAARPRSGQTRLVKPGGGCTTSHPPTSSRTAWSRPWPGSACPQASSFIPVDYRKLRIIFDDSAALIYERLYLKNLLDARSSAAPPFPRKLTRRRASASGRRSLRARTPCSNGRSSRSGRSSSG